MVTIRPATPQDYPAVRELTRAAYVGHVDSDSSYAQSLQDVLSRREGLHVAVLDEQVVGAVNIAPPGSVMAQVAADDELEFRMLAVSPEHQGRGIGRAIVQYVLDLAQTQGLAGVALTTMTSMTTAQAMYDAMGFRRAPERDWNLYTAGIVNDPNDATETFPVYVHPLNTPPQPYVKEIHG